MEKNGMEKYIYKKISYIYLILKINLIKKKYIFFEFNYFIFYIYLLFNL